MTSTPCLSTEAGTQDAGLRFFDEHGRCVPGELYAPVHARTRRYFVIEQPAIDYAAIHGRLARHLCGGNCPSAGEFQERAEAILQGLRGDPAVAGIVNGVAVPFMLPKADYPEYGTALEDIYLGAVNASFNEKFPDYRFTNHHKGSLAGKLSVAPGSRHERLLEEMRVGPVVGYYFPCLTEYSVPAAIERMATLPDRFLLAGGYDTSAALVGSPDLLLRRDGYPPLLWLTALRGEKEQVGYHYEAYGYNLTFNRRPHFGEAAEYWTSGLVVLG